MFFGNDNSEEFVRLTNAFKTNLNDCMEKDDEGRLKMTIAIPDEAFLDNMAKSLAQVVSAGRG